MTKTKEVFTFTDEEVDPHFDYGPVVKALRKLKKKPDADKARQILAKYKCNCETAAAVLHDLGLIPDLKELELSITSQAVSAITRKLKIRWSIEEDVDLTGLANEHCTG